MQISLLTLFALTAIGSERVHAQTWTVSAKPVVTIGEVEGAPEYLFRGISHVRRLSDGQIVVVTGTDIRFYNDKGKYRSKAGGRGGGPGEFQHIGDFHVLTGDTLLVLSELGPVWLTREGKYVRQQPIDYAKYGGDGWFTEMAGGVLLPNGQFLAAQFPQLKPNEPRPAFHRPQVRYAVLDPLTKDLKPLFTAGGTRQLVRPAPAGGIAQPFSPQSQHAIGFDRIYLGDNDTTFLSVFAFDGKPLGTIRVADRAVPVTAQELSAYREGMLKAFGTNAQRKTQFERNWDDVEKPRRHPFWGTALVDRTGNLWISDRAAFRFAPPRATAWSVFDREGRRVGSATMPAGFQLKEIGSDYLLGVARDEFDVEYVHLYSLTKPRR
jgi:hypothetical protein